MSKSRFREISFSVHKIAKFEYFAKVIIYSKSPDHCFKMIYNTFIFLKFDIFSKSCSGAIAEAISRKVLIKSRNQNIFQIFKMNPIRC